MLYTGEVSDLCVNLLVCFCWYEEVRNFQMASETLDSVFFLLRYVCMNDVCSLTGVHMYGYLYYTCVSICILMFVGVYWWGLGQSSSWLIFSWRTTKCFFLTCTGNSTFHTACKQWLWWYGVGFQLSVFRASVHLPRLQGDHWTSMGSRSQWVASLCTIH